jgi:nucleotide-binding universal stress UspA family protein
MFRTILLCTDGSEPAGIATDYAIWFARKLNATVRALFITDIRLLEGPLMADLSGAIGAQPYPSLLPMLQQMQRDKADAVLGNVAKRCGEHNVPCDTTHQTGNLVATMLDQERSSDLVVLGQRGEHASLSHQVLGSSVERMVRSSFRPCLVTTNQFRPVRRMLLAFDGSAESTKALHAALRLTPKLESALTVVTVCQREHEEQAADTLQAARRIASESGVELSLQMVHGHPESEILRFATENEIDLIVMGAYGHTRIREFILGSTTSAILHKTTIPVFMVRGEL